MIELDKELSGRELDAAVAERVMGWERNPDYKNVKVPILDMAFEWYASGYGSNDLPRFSESIEAAMQVVEKIRADYAWDIESWATSAFTGWEVNLWKDGDIAGGYRNESLTVAICRAALAAIGSKE